MNPKLIAVYFPQFHNIPENDSWWGKNFTDWELVKKAKPLFKSHYQPRVPIDEDYYDPCKKETFAKQIKLAKDYNIEGFMMYHYWFDGRLILEKPLEVFLKNKDLDIPFCLSWANGSWTRQWLGNNEILLEQRHISDETLWERHFNYLLPFFKDSRAIKINNKPVFAIYNPDIIKRTSKMFAFWQNLAKLNGLDGIYFIAMKNYDFAKPTFLKSYDAIMKFQPREANTSSKNPKKQKLMSLSFLRLLPERIQNKFANVRLKVKSKTIISSQNIWNQVIKYAYQNDYPQFKLDVYESAFFDWDNTARYGKKATIYTPQSFEEKKENLKALFDKAKENNVDYIFYNAWNEWSESAYLEPDKKYGYTNLEIIKEIQSL